jgi:hypothetical protein
MLVQIQSEPKRPNAGAPESENINQPKNNTAAAARPIAAKTIRAARPSLGSRKPVSRAAPLALASARTASPNTPISSTTPNPSDPLPGAERRKSAISNDERERKDFIKSLSPERRSRTAPRRGPAACVETADPPEKRAETRRNAPFDAALGINERLSQYRSPKKQRMTFALSCMLEAQRRRASFDYSNQTALQRDHHP